MGNHYPSCKHSQPIEVVACLLQSYDLKVALLSSVQGALDRIFMFVIIKKKKALAKPQVLIHFILNICKKRTIMRHFSHRDLERAE